MSASRVHLRSKKRPAASSLEQVFDEDRVEAKFDALEVALGARDAHRNADNSRLGESVRFVSRHRVDQRALL